MAVQLDAKAPYIEKPFISPQNKDLLIRIGKIAVVVLTATAILAVSAGIFFVACKFAIAATPMLLVASICFFGGGIGTLLSLTLLVPPRNMRDNEVLANMFKVTDRNGQDCLDFIQETAPYIPLFFLGGIFFPLTFLVLGVSLRGLR